MRPIEKPYVSGDDASFALGLVTHPRLASSAGLGGLAGVLRRDAGYAARHGWAATLTRVLDAHPRYAAAHHLTGFTLTQTPPTGTTAPTTPDPPKTASTTSVSPAAPAVVQDPLTIAAGGNLDVTLPGLGLTGSLTYTITPQPLPANMTFNRGWKAARVR